MDIVFDATWIVTLLLVSLRLAMLFFITPLDAAGRVPTRVKLLVCIGLSLMLVMALDLEIDAMPATILDLAIAAANEALIGLILAFGFYCAFGAVAIGGQLLDFQGGFGAANILNPAANTSDSLFGTVFALLLVLIFFSVDGQTYLMRSLARSLQIIPPGHSLPAFPFEVILRQFGLMFTFGIALAAPVIAALLLVDTAVGIMARSMPQLNVYFLFLPVKLALVLVLTAGSLRFVQPWLERLFSSLFIYWRAVVVT